MLGFLSRFVDSNDRELKRIQPFVDEINALEPEIQALSDAEIQERFQTLRAEIQAEVVEEEPSDDELHHPDLERRRELTKQRKKRNLDAWQAALDSGVPEVFAMGREAYAADITYGTNNEFGFDYLRDNMVTELDQRVQRERYFGIVDEVDNILIDEARTPLIISGQAEESADLYFTFARLVPRLRERALGVENLYDSDPRYARPFEQALRAHALYKRDRDYIVKEGEI